MGHHRRDGFGIDHMAVLDSIDAGLDAELDVFRSHGMDRHRFPRSMALLHCDGDLLPREAAGEVAARVVDAAGDQQLGQIAPRRRLVRTALRISSAPSTALPGHSPP